MISKHVIDTLEYSKVLEYVSKYSQTELGKEILLKSLPFNSVKVAKESGLKVSEAKEILINNTRKEITSPQIFIENNYQIKNIHNFVIKEKKTLNMLFYKLL